MTREEAIRLTLLYLTERDDEGTPTLDYSWMLTSLTEYATCWYVDFRYQHAAGPLPQSATGMPGFIIDKKTQHIEVISWPQLFELNCERLPY